MCGAAVSSDLPRCEHCGARLATVACPSCFGLIFQGAKFCPHCGAKVERTETAEDAHQLCPRCKVDLNSVEVGNTKLRECPKCEGVWVDKDAFEKICADREQQATVLGTASALPQPGSVDLEKNIRYIPCPVCHKLMNRVNFAHCSGVVVDVCRVHGTWFDRDELRRIVEFIRSGGLERARMDEINDLEDERRRARDAQITGTWGAATRSLVGSDYADHQVGIPAIADSMLDYFLR